MGTVLLLGVTIVGCFGMLYAHTVSKPMAERRIRIRRVLPGADIRLFVKPDEQARSSLLHGRRSFSVSRQTRGEEWVRVTTWEDRRGWALRREIEAGSKTGR